MSGQPTVENNPMQPRKTRNKFIRCVTCNICSDLANDHDHYGGVCCYSCRAFFRRHTVSTKKKILRCSYNNQCEINISSRKLCPACRYKKCLDVGMKRDWVMSDQDKNERQQMSSRAGRPLVRIQTNYERRRK